jgi:RimJ/RimL family protein N-acetyltransferase
MTDTLAGYPADLVADVSTSLGTVHVRPIRPSDRDALIAFHEALSPDSQYLRFFTAHPHLLPKEAERFTNVDYDRRLALVAELDGRLIAVGRYDRLDGPEAEVAFVVADDCQCHGIGTLLLRRLADAALARGITTFVAETLSSNLRMQAVFRESGFDTHAAFDEGLVNFRFRIVHDDL